MRRRLGLLVLPALALSVLASCRPADPAPAIRLPPTSVLSTRSTYAVVMENILRIRDQPSRDATVVHHIRRGDIVEVVSRTETTELVEGTEGYWYLVDYSGLKGWVFGGYLTLVGTRAEAERLAGTLE